jgi:hypothetical protein
MAKGWSWPHAAVSLSVDRMVQAALGCGELTLPHPSVHSEQSPALGSGIHRGGSEVSWPLTLPLEKQTQEQMGTGFMSCFGPSKGASLGLVCLEGSRGPASGNGAAFPDLVCNRPCCGGPASHPVPGLVYPPEWELGSFAKCTGTVT